MADTSKVVIQEPDIKFEELGESARKLRKQLLQIPVNRAEKALKFMAPCGPPCCRNSWHT